MTAPDALQRAIARDLYDASERYCDHDDAAKRLLSGPLAPILDRLDKLEKDAMAMLIALSEQAMARGEAEGRLRASKDAGILKGWHDRALAAEGRLSELEAENTRLRDALKPFCFGDPTIENILFGDMSDDKTVTFTISLGHTRRARAALNGASDA